MKKIKLTQGKYALVDDEDFEYLSQWKWSIGGRGYATRSTGGRKNKRTVLMHRMLNATPMGYHTDHINHNKLDNRKINLRTTTPSQNILNSNLSKKNISGYKGVSYYKNRWVARIRVNYKDVYLGRYEKLEEALRARKEAEELYCV